MPPCSSLSSVIHANYIQKHSPSLQPVIHPSSFPFHHLKHNKHAELIVSQGIYNNQQLQRMQSGRKEMLLEKEQPYEQSNRVKYQHLAGQNAHLLQTVSQLETQIESLRKINDQLLMKTPKSIQILIEQLTLQNRNLQRSLFRLVKNNESLSCDLLMKDQLFCEAEREHREMIDSYDEKVYELRISLQNKETAVSAMEDKLNELKEDPYGCISKVNLMYYNEINELKAMHDRLNLQNSQLRFLNAVKDEELDRLRAVLERYDRNGKKEDWRRVEGEASEQSRTKKQEARNKLEEELTRYDTKYKNMSSTKQINTGNQINSLKFAITHLNKENRDLQAEIKKVRHSLAVRDKQYRLLQQAYKKIQAQLIFDKVEVQFYRDHFKQLSKVATQRKIKFYDQYHDELLPTLERRLHERQQLIAYWKHWQKSNPQVTAKCVLTQAQAVKLGKRSMSCTVKYSYIVQSTKRKVCAKEKEEAIFSFINETHNVDSLVNYTIDAKHAAQQEPAFNDDISVIIKPKVVESPYSKKRAVG